MAAKQWSALSERRLFKKLLEHKPAGVSKRFQMVCLTQMLNKVYDDEDTDFEDLLTPQDAKKARMAKQNRSDTDTTEIFSSNAYEPTYSLRPTPRDVWTKLDELYDMELIEENEYIPDEFSKQLDFFLPDGEFSELTRIKEEEAHKGGTSRQETPQPLRPPRPTRRKRRDSGETQSHSSRSSTPSWSRDLRRS